MVTATVAPSGTRSRQRKRRAVPLPEKVPAGWGCRLGSPTPRRSCPSAAGASAVHDQGRRLGSGGRRAGRRPPSAEGPAGLSRARCGGTRPRSRTRSPGSLRLPPLPPSRGASAGGGDDVRARRGPRRGSAHELGRRLGPRPRARARRPCRGMRPRSRHSAQCEVLLELLRSSAFSASSA